MLSQVKSHGIVIFFQCLFGCWLWLCFWIWFSSFCHQEKLSLGNFVAIVFKIQQFYTTDVKGFFPPTGEKCNTRHCLFLDIISLYMFLALRKKTSCTSEQMKFIKQLRVPCVSVFSASEKKVLSFLKHTVKHTLFTCVLVFLSTQCRIAK